MDSLLTIPTDTILSILGLAFSVGGLVPLFRLNGQKKTVIISLAVVLSALLAISAITYVRIQKREQQVDVMSAAVVERISTRSMTFDQLYEELYYPDFSILSDAMDTLIKKGTVGHRVLEVRDDKGEAFRVKGYFAKSR